MIVPGRLVRLKTFVCRETWQRRGTDWLRNADSQTSLELQAQAWVEQTQVLITSASSPALTMLFESPDELRYVVSLTVLYSLPVEQV